MRSFARSAFFLSGVAGLTFEIVWMRHLGLAMGVTTFAVATTTAAYMGGLAIGSYFGGRLADRLRRLLAFYGVTEIAIGLGGLLVPALCALVPYVDATLFAELESSLLRGMVRFVVAFFVLILPTVGMGMTLPVLARTVTDNVNHVGREVGLLYALNIAGAVVGAGLTGFVWLPTLGLNATNLLAAGIDVVLGLAAIAVGLLVKSAANVEPLDAEARAAPVLHPGRRGLVWLLALTGASGMALQVLWTRALGTALGPSTYAFSAIVCTYLAGLAIGGAIASRVADNVRAVRFVLAWVLIGTGMFAFIGIALVDDLPVLLRDVVVDEHVRMSGLLRTKFGLAALSVLPATIGMGALFPLTLAAIAGSHKQIGAAVGQAYAINTIGAIGGAFAAAFVLLPLVGVEWSMRICAFGYLLAGGWLAWRSEASVIPSSRVALGITTALVMFITVTWPSWDIGRWTLGIFRLSMTRVWYPDGPIEPSKVIFHRDGLAATVTVEEGSSSRWIKVDGKIDGSTQGDMPTQVLSGALPMLFAPSPKRVAIIGCGTGVTVGSVLEVGAEQVTLIELEKEVIEGAKLFGVVNHSPWDDPRLRIVTDDGRNFLRRSHDQFDIIISEPSNPWMTSAASLFTVEFFQIAAQRLHPDGVFLQWLQSYELSPKRIGAVLQTFRSIFPHVAVFTPDPLSSDLLLLGSSRPFQLDWDDLEQRFETMRPELRRAGVHLPEQVLARFLFSEKDIEFGDVQLNTDDNVLIEFGAPRDLVTYATSDPEVPLLVASDGHRHDFLREILVIDPSRRAEIWLRLADSFLELGMLSDAAALAKLVADLGDEPYSEQAAILIEVADLLGAKELEIAVDAETAAQDPLYEKAARLLSQGESDAALKIFKSAPKLSRRSPTHALLHGYLLYRTGKGHEAKKALTDAFGPKPALPPVAYYLAREAYWEGDYARAAQQMKAYHASAAGAGANNRLPTPLIPD